MLHPLPSPPFRHSKSQAAITSPLQPRNPTLLRPPRHRCPAGASSPTTSSTATARRPSFTSPDEDPLSISPSHRFSRPILHLQGAAPMIASSIAAAPSPQRRLNLLDGTTTSSPTPRTKPRPTRRHQRGCTLIASHLLLNSTSRRRRCSIPHPHGAATLKPAPRATSPWRLFPSARPLRRRRPYQPDLLLLLRLSLARSRCCCCSGSRSIARSIARSPSCCCCSPPRLCC